MGVLVGAEPDGLVPVAWFLWKNPCCTLTLVNPACCSVCCAWLQFWPCTLGIGVAGGPADTETVTVCPGFTGVCGAGVWETIVPCGSLLCTVVCCRVIWFWPAHCWIELMFWLTRLGSASPSIT